MHATWTVHCFQRHSLPAFFREQILVYNNPDNDMERTGGLNLINTTNLSFFDPPQKSELFRLKAIFLASLGGRSKSNQAYCHSVQICPTHAKGWVSWGRLCASLGVLTEKQADQLAAKSGGSAESSKVSSKWMQHAVKSHLFLKQFKSIVPTLTRNLGRHPRRWHNT